jgi:hypothetical protein
MEDKSAFTEAIDVKIGNVLLSLPKVLAHGIRNKFTKL